MSRSRRKSARHRRKPDPLARSVGERIKRLRIEQDFNFDAWVEETGLGRGYISELERGMVIPTIQALKKVADALELPLADIVLVGDSDREKLFNATRGLTGDTVRELLRTAETRASRRK